MLSKLLLVLVLATLGLNAQSIEILDVITTNYPEMKAEIRAIDGNGNEFRNFGATNPPELTLRENGQVVPIKMVQCEANVKRFSLIISLDVSGSMAAQQTPQGITRAQLAKNVLVNLANNFPWDRG